MNVEKHFRAGPDGFDDMRPEGNVRHEMAVHDIQVQPLRARPVGALDLFGEASVIRGQQRGRNNHARSVTNCRGGSQRPHAWSRPRFYDWSKVRAAMAAEDSVFAAGIRAPLSCAT